MQATSTLEAPPHLPVVTPALAAGGLPALPDLAAPIREAVREANAHARSFVQHAGRAGELLLQVKAAISHGEWSRWVEQQCELSQRSAQGYMRLARRLRQLPSCDREALQGVPLRQALQAISGPATATTQYQPPQDSLQAKLADLSKQLRQAARGVDSAAAIRGRAARGRITEQVRAVEAAVAALQATLSAPAA